MYRIIAVNGNVLTFHRNNNGCNNNDNNNNTIDFIGFLKKYKRRSDVTFPVTIAFENKLFINDINFNVERKAEIHKE